MGFKVGLVLQGGGTRSAFTSGVLDTLMENKISFPYIIGTSAGALNAVNVLSGDIGRSKDVDILLMDDKKFISLHNLLHYGSLFNFTYLVVDVPKNLIPFNAKAYNESPVHLRRSGDRTRRRQRSLFRERRMHRDVEGDRGFFLAPSHHMEAGSWWKAILISMAVRPRTFHSAAR
jgi:hypothetical protein